MPFADDLEKRQRRFAEAFNRVFHRASILSPDSPDFAARLSEQWNSRGVGEKFRELEEVIRGPHYND